MLEILNGPRLETKIWKRLEFHSKYNDNIVLSVPIYNEKGIIPLDEDENPCNEEDCKWWKKYKAALKNPSLLSKKREIRKSFKIPLMVRCDCGNIFPVDDKEFIMCDNCNKWYNASFKECNKPN